MVTEPISRQPPLDAVPFMTYPCANLFPGFRGHGVSSYRMVGMLQTKELPQADRDVRLHLAGAPEYRFLKCLERGPLGETWRVRTVDDKKRLAQFLPPGDHDAAIERLQFIHAHKCLVPFTVARRNDDQPFLVTQIYPRTLADRFDECWRQGLPGIPRPELCAYLRRLGEALDALYLKFRMQHLALQPKNLLLHEGRLLIAGFGWAEFFWAPTQQPYSLLNPRYAAPELYHNRVHGHSDQYSFALIYTEMATGVHPLRAHRDNFPGNGKLDLALLSHGERAIIARALSPNPAERFLSLPSLVRALEEAGAARANSKDAGPLSPIISYVPGQAPESASVAQGSLDHFISDLVLLATGPAQVREFNKIRYRLEPGRQLGHRFAVQHFPGAAGLKLDGFRQQWHADLLRQEDGLLIFSVHTAPSFWHALIGQPVGLEIQVRLAAPPGGRRSEVNVVIRPFGCGRKNAIQLLEEMGPRVLESLRSYLLAHPEQRSNERLLCSHPLRICPVVGGIELADPIDCFAKDVSIDGIGFYLPKSIPTPQVYVNTPGVPELAAVAGLAQVVRKKPCGDGWYEIGASFARARQRKN
jgi:serine/threonine protein kinase